MRKKPRIYPRGTYFLVNYRIIPSYPHPRSCVHLQQWYVLVNENLTFNKNCSWNSATDSEPTASTLQCSLDIRETVAKNATSHLNLWMNNWLQKTLGVWVSLNIAHLSQRYLNRHSSIYSVNREVSRICRVIRYAHINRNRYNKTKGILVHKRT